MCISWTNKEFDIINARCNLEDRRILLYFGTISLVTYRPVLNKVRLSLRVIDIMFLTAYLGFLTL